MNRVRDFISSYGIRESTGHGITAEEGIEFACAFLAGGSIVGMALTPNPSPIRWARGTKLAHRFENVKGAELKNRRTAQTIRSRHGAAEVLVYTPDLLNRLFK